MKTFIITMLALLSLNSFAFEAEVVSAHFQVEDELQEKSLCLTIVKIPESGELLGIVEGIGDCFYARAAKRESLTSIEIDERNLGPISHQDLLQHLQRMDTDLRFYFSNGE